MSLLDCIERIPSCLTNIVNSKGEIKQKIQEMINGKEVEELVFVASGTSYNSCNVTRYFAKGVCDLNVRCFFPNDFVHYTNYFNEKALYVVISQGGATRLVYQALEKIKEHGLMNCSITEKLDSPIAQLADLALEMGSVHEEYLYRTIGYSATVTTCWLMEICLAEMLGKIDEKQANDLIAEMRLAIGNLSNIKETSISWYKQNQFALMRRNKIILAGAECFFETANEADIKLMEMVPIFTRSFELEELIHGPQNAFDYGTTFFLLADQRKDARKIKQIAQFLKNEIGYCVVVGNQSVDERDLTFDLVSEHFTAIEEITAFQIIAYYLATDHGRDLTRGVNTSMNNYIQKTM